MGERERDEEHASGRGSDTARAGSAGQAADETPWPSHSTNTAEGMIQSLGRIASLGAWSPGWRRRVAVGVLVLVALVFVVLPVMLIVLAIIA